MIAPRVSPRLIGDSVAMHRLYALIAKVAPTPLSVWIEGPTGSGKELVAASLHERSGRRGPLVCFNVCAVGESVFEDALFGHVRGAYTGAVNDALGFLREAHGGTVFLDEITGLPIALQLKLLRAVETGVFRPIGASRDASSDFRTIVATNERVARLLDEGRFRADLAHRLSGMVITVPSLAERTEDIPQLVEHFVARASIGSVRVTSGALQMLARREWPGNVRELKQVVDAALAMMDGEIDEHTLNLVFEYRDRTLAPGDAPRALGERHSMLSMLERAAWDVDRAARMLGRHRATIYRQMKRLGIVRPRIGSRPSGSV